MTDGFQSIEDLMKEDDSGEASTKEATVQQKFQSKQDEIKKKEVEREMESTAASKNLPYINLAGFPISPEALAQINEEESGRLKAVCFFYDGDNFRLGAVEKTEEVD